MKMLKRFLPVLAALMICVSAAAAGADSRLDTLRVASAFVPSPAKAIVAKPRGAAPSCGWPTLYLLHGLTGNYTNWATHAPLDSLANAWGMVIVCPDGYDSWYWDTPASVLKDSFMESYITRELVPAVRRAYPVDTLAASTAIAGLSMGGHGALWLGGRHPELFGAIGSMSGAVEIEAPSVGRKAGIPRLLGKQFDAERWKAHSATSVIPALKAHPVPLILECGSEDFLYATNEDYHKRLLDNHIPHTFISRPGDHTWDFWVAALPRFMQFFSENFPAR